MRKDILSSYERHSLLMNRIAQIENNAPTTLDNISFQNLQLEKCFGFFEKAEKIAEEELRKKVIPLSVNRPLSTGGYEVWKIEDLEDINK